MSVFLLFETEAFNMDIRPIIKAVEASSILIGLGLLQKQLSYILQLAEVNRDGILMIQEMHVLLLMKEQLGLLCLL